MRKIPERRMLLDLYRRMVLIRETEQAIADRYSEDKMRCPTHLSIGQEAVAVGVCAHLTDYDFVVGTHRNHAAYLAKGGDLNRMIAEMYGKETGCANGRGGSMHLVDVERGMYGASAIVGGSMPLPVGAALAFQMRDEGGIGVAFFGDAAVEPGVFHECMNFAALRRLPVVFVCENNGYSTMTTQRERQCVPIAERAAGYGIPGVRIDGNDVLEVYAAMEDAMQRASEDNGPMLIEATTYRWREHVEHNAGIMHRPKGEKAYWRARCPVARFRREILSYGVPESELAQIERDVKNEIDAAFRFAEESPFPKPCELLRGVGDEIVQLPEPSLLPCDRLMTYAAAIAEATVQAMQDDPNVFVAGLHVTDPNGVFGTTVPAFQEFGPGRVFETPICEASMTSILGGAAMMGMRPIHVHARVEFLLLALSQLGNDLSAWSYMTGGKVKVPLVIRAIIGRSRGQGAQHSKDMKAAFAQFPGLHVVAPSNAYDAKGMLLTALSGDTPVVFLEHRLCHPLTEKVPVERYRIPFGRACVRRTGTDVTIVAALYMVHEAERAAERLVELGINAEVIDLRSIRPWDKETVCASVRKTGRLIVADTGWVDFGISGDIVACVTEHEFSSLKVAPKRIGLPPCPTPMSEVLETAYYPGPAEIVNAALVAMGRASEATYADGKSADIGDKPF